ncbi:MAG TPA: hypothetical protein VKS21_00540 [Spirochaetota bacterium]|nr:hypothetical protein [Spirochaetota bacterium]
MDFITLKKEIEKWDPAGLLDGKTPVNEYDRLCNDLYAKLPGPVSTAELKQLIDRELQENFGISIEKIASAFKERYFREIEDFTRKINNME